MSVLLWLDDYRALFSSARLFLLFFLVFSGDTAGSPSPHPDQQSEGNSDTNGPPGCFSSWEKFWFLTVFNTNLNQNILITVWFNVTFYIIPFSWGPTKGPASQNLQLLPSSNGSEVVPGPPSPPCCLEAWCRVEGGAAAAGSACSGGSASGCGPVGGPWCSLCSGSAPGCSWTVWFWSTGASCPTTAPTTRARGSCRDWWVRRSDYRSLVLVLHRLQTSLHWRHRHITSFLPMTDLN